MDTIDLVVTLRDPNDPTAVIGNQMAYGTTEDDGVTVVIPLGYVPDIVTSAMSDVVMNVTHPPVPKTPTGVVSRTDDYENGISTIVFSY